MKCDRQLLSTYCDGDLSYDERRQVESHLATCPDCRAVLREYRRLGLMVRTSRTVATPPADLAVRFRVRATAQPPSLTSRIGKLLGTSSPRPSLAMSGFGTLVAALIVVAVFHNFTFAPVSNPELAAATVAPAQVETTSVAPGEPIVVPLPGSTPPVNASDVVVSVNPPIPHETTIEGNTVRIRPTEPLQPGTAYTVTVEARQTVAPEAGPSPTAITVTVGAASSGDSGPHPTATTGPSATAPAAGGASSPVGTATPASGGTAVAQQAPASPAPTEPAAVELPPTEPAPTAQRSPTPRVPAPTPRRANTPTPVAPPATPAASASTAVAAGPTSTPGGAAVAAAATATRTAMPPATSGIAGVPTSGPCDGGRSAQLDGALRAQPDLDRKLGCATSDERPVTTITQGYERGVVVWSVETHLIAVLLGSGQGTVQTDGANADGATALGQANDVLARFWQAHPDLREAIGAPATGPSSRTTFYQSFAHGFVVGAEPGAAYVLTDGATWQRIALVPAPSTSVTATPAVVGTATPTPPEPGATASPRPSATVSPTSTPAPPAGATATPTPSPDVPPVPANTGTVAPSPTASATGTETPVPPPAPTATPVPASRPSSTDNTPTPQPTQAPAPTATATATAAAPAPTVAVSVSQGH